MKNNTKNYAEQVKKEKSEVSKSEQSKINFDKLQSENGTLKNKIIGSLKKTVNSKSITKEVLETEQTSPQKINAATTKEESKESVNVSDNIHNNNHDDNFVHPSDVLREERIKQKLTEKEVALKLKITSSKISDIENKNFDAIKSVVFLQGYVKLYAELLNLDSLKIEQNLVKVLNDFQNLKTKKTTTIKNLKKPSSNRKTLLMNAATINGYDRNYFTVSKKSNYIFFIVLILLLSSVIYYFINNLPEKKEESKESKEILTIPITVEQNGKTNQSDQKASLIDESINKSVEVKLSSFSQNKSNEQVIIETSQNESIQSSVVATMQTDNIVTIQDNLDSKNKLQKNQKVTPNTNQNENQVSNNTISLFFIDDSWIEIIDKSIYPQRVIYSKLYKKGEEIFLYRYNKKLEFTFGKASVVQMYIAKKPFDLRDFTNTLDVAKFNLTF